MLKAAVAGKLLQSPDVRATVQNITPSVWFSPVNPLAPLAQQPEQAAIGRRYDYMTGYNLNITPRFDSAISFAQLRQLADSYDILRLLIENLKEKICMANWHIVPNDDLVPKEQQAKYKNDPMVAEITRFFMCPDGINDWRAWLRALLEDMLVIDAMTLYPQRTRGGKLLRLDLMDGGTIKPVIDAYGRRPMAPDVAYQQIIKGIPSVDYSSEELYYRPRNLRTNRVYGYSPVEQIIVTVNIALRRQLYQLEYYKDGSIPDTLFAMPDGWTPDQLAQFELLWNSMLAGNLAGRRQAKFVPKDTKMLNAREAQLKDEYDEWLARVCCFAFGTSPQPFIKMMNRATAQTMKETADEEGALPYMTTIQDFMSYIIANEFGREDLVLRFKPLSEMDPLKRAQADDVDIRNGLKSIDEIRVERNLPPVGMGPAVITPTGPIMLDPFISGTVTGVQQVDQPAQPEQPPQETDQGAVSQGKPTPKGGKSTKKAAETVLDVGAEADAVIKMARAAAVLGARAGSTEKGA